MITLDGDNSSTVPNTLYASFGVMGGFMQPQGHMQVVVSLTDDGADPQSALDRPRFCIDDGTPAGQVALEQGYPPEVGDGLEKMGHHLYWVNGLGRSLFGRGQIILRDAVSGVLCGGSDPRADGCAMSLYLSPVI
jgi:gamma-glutamyltranspeptidase/glutathione hydrolase